MQVVSMDDRSKEGYWKGYCTWDAKPLASKPDMDTCLKIELTLPAQVGFDFHFGL